MGTHFQIIVCDSSVLINFLKIDRLDLFEAHSHEFLVTDIVQEEITEHYPTQKKHFEAALGKGILKVVRVDDPLELDLFAKLIKSGQLGSGECSAIAVAGIRGHKIAIEDNRAIKSALSLLPTLEILRTQDLLIAMISEGILTIQEADEMLQDWAANHRFKVKLQSIREMLVD